jgi:uncharacterized protein YkwD
MYRSYFYGLLVVTGVVAALIGMFGGEKLEEAAVLSMRFPEPVASTSIDQTNPADFSFAEPNEESTIRLAPTTTTTALITTTTLAPATTAAPTTTQAPAEQPPETQPKKSAPPPPATEGGFNAGYESAFASSINSYRSSQGLAGLSRNGSLDAEARSWAKRMAERGDLSHSDLGRFIPPWSAAAENVGTGGSVSSLFDALTASSGHRTNMLGGYTHFGIGVWVDGSGSLWTAHVFTG